MKEIAVDVLAFLSVNPCAGIRKSFICELK